jgi:hypothetical protein
MTSPLAHPTSIVLTRRAKGALKKMERELNLTRSQVLELAVRVLARRLWIKLSKSGWFPKLKKKKAGKDSRP